MVHTDSERLDSTNNTSFSRPTRNLWPGKALVRTDTAGYPWLMLIAISVAMIMSVIDTTVVNVALAKLEAVFGVGTDSIQWISTGYLLSFGITLAATGWLADRFGYKSIFLLAIALFTIASFLCSISWNLSSLIFFRIVQGIGGGMMAPVSMAILLREFPKEKLGIAMAVYSMPAMASAAFGPTLGGWLIDSASWQMIFGINIPIGIAGFAVSYAVLRPYATDNTKRFDFLGFGSLAVALGALLLALADANASWNTGGWTSPFTLGCIGVSGAGFALFAICQFTTDHPVVDLSLFKIYNFSLMTIFLLAYGFGMFGNPFLLPLYLQNVLGYTPMQAGSVFIPYGLVEIVAMLIGGKLRDRVGAKIPGIIGILIMAYGMYRFSFLSPDTSYAYILLSECIFGLGFGLLASPLQTTAMSSIPRARSSQGSALFQTVRQVIASFDIALLSTILIQRQQFHTAIVGQQMSSSAHGFKTAVSQIASLALHTTGGTASQALSKAKMVILSNVNTKIFSWSIDDLYFLMSVLCIVSAALFLLVRTKRARQTNSREQKTARKAILEN